MQIDFTQPILDQKNEPVTDGPFMTLQSVCALACFAQIRGDENLSPEKKAELGFLGLQIQHSESLDLRVEQIAMLKDRIGRIASNLVVHRAFTLLDPQDKAVSKAIG